MRGNSIHLCGKGKRAVEEQMKKEKIRSIAQERKWYQKIAQKVSTFDP
jgi:hypothetical protein